MEQKRYQFNREWLTKKEISDKVLHKKIPLKGKFGDLRFYGFCNTEIENAIVEKDFKISITKTFIRNYNEKYFKLSDKTYYFEKMEKVQSGN
jgi:hypothetical protein